MRAAVRFVRERSDCFPDGAVPRYPAQIAVLAVEASHVFLGRASATAGATSYTGDGRLIARAMIEASRQLETP